MSYTKLPIFKYPDYDRGDFTKMDNKDAQNFFIDFKEKKNQRIEDLSCLLRKEIFKPDWSMYTSNTEVLNTLEVWLLSHLEIRKRTEQDFIEMGVNQAADIKVFVNDWEFTDDTKNLIAYSGLAWGEFLIFNTNGTYWEQVKKPKSSVDLNQPCIRGNTKAVCNPFSIINIVCLKAKEGSPLNQELSRLFNLWSKFF